MRKMICVFALALMALSAEAATLTATIEIPDPIATEVLATVNAWRLTQRDPDGALLYPTLAALGDSILRHAILKIVQAHCASGAAECPTAIKAKIDARETARDEVEAEIDGSVATP